MKISIITINLNNARGLLKTINSVINQTYTDIEFIIIDGASSDSSTDLIKSIERKISYWTSEKDCGMYEAMNKGLLQATGEYLLFLNSGDSLANYDVIQNVVLSLNNEEIVYGNINVVSNRKYKTLKIQTFPKRLSLNYFIEGAIPHQGMFIKKSLFEVVGPYDVSLKICADWKFKIDAVCKYKCSYKHIDLIVSDFADDGISSKQENQDLIQQEKKRVLIDDYFLLEEDMELLKEYKDLAFYYENSKRVTFFKKLNILKRMLTGKYFHNYNPG